MSGDDMDIREITTEEELELCLIGNDRPVAVDIFTSWCLPCQELERTMERVSLESNALICKLDAEKLPDVARKYGVEAYPTVVVFSHGKVFKKMVGLCSRAGIIKVLEDAANA